MTDHFPKPFSAADLARGRVIDAISDVEDMTLAFEALGALVGDLHPSMAVKHYALGLVIDSLNAELRRRVSVASVALGETRNAPVFQPHA